MTESNPDEVEVSIEIDAATRDIVSQKFPTLSDGEILGETVKAIADYAELETQGQRQEKLKKIHDEKDELESELDAVQNEYYALEGRIEELQSAIDRCDVRKQYLLMENGESDPQPPMNQADRTRILEGIISELHVDDYDEIGRGVPINMVADRAAGFGMSRPQVKRGIERLGRQGDVYKPNSDTVRPV